MEIKAMADFNPCLYIKSDWNPPKAELDIKKMLNNFFDNIDSERNNCKSKIGPASNLTQHKQMIMNWLQGNKEIIVSMADTNLGIVMVNRQSYIKCMLEQHLMDETTYQMITEEEVRNFMKDFLEQAKSLILFKYDKYLTG